MATFESLSNLLTPTVVSYLETPSGLPELPKGLGYEVAVTDTGVPFRTGSVIPTGITQKSALQIAVEALGPLTAIFSGPSGVAASISKTALSQYSKSQLPTIQPQYLGRPTMSFADGDTGFFGGTDVLGDISKVFQGGFGQNLLNIGTQALQGYVSQQFQPAQFQLTGPVAAAVPAVAGTMAIMGRALATRFPALAAAIAGFASRGIVITRSKLYALARRFGPDFLVTGGILSAAALSELMVAGPGRRRMNPGNIKALRKAHRRMKAFHQVCRSNDMLLGGRRKGRKSIGFGGSTSVVSVK